jgi:hypothetical protein
MAALFALAAIFGAHLPVNAQDVSPVFGLRGKVEPVANQPYAHVLTEAGGLQYALVGSTPEVEAEITETGRRRATIKVWGTLQERRGSGVRPLIVATAVVEESSPLVVATPTVPITPVGPGGSAPDVTATITVYAAYVREGPDSQYASVGTVNEGTVCKVTGRSLTPGWLRVTCPGVAGWIKEGLFEVQGPVTSVSLFTGPTPTPTPTATATPGPGSWRVLAYNNRDLSGDPAANYQSPDVNFEWGGRSPFPGVAEDNYSLRFDSAQSFAPGDYRFDLTYDDGARLYVNGQLVASDWAEGGRRSTSWQGRLAGEVPLRIEYFEAYGDSLLQLTVTSLQIAAPTSFPLPVVTPAAAPPGYWLATYFNNTTLQGSPAFTRLEPRGDVYPLNYEYSLSSPVPGIIGEDNWSARWRGRFFFPAADYRFISRGKDGVRVYIDGIRVIDAWPNTSDVVTNIFRQVGAGEHEIVVEMYNSGGLAWVRAWWEQLVTGGDGRDR